MIEKIEQNVQAVASWHSENSDVIVLPVVSRYLKDL